MINRDKHQATFQLEFFFFFRGAFLGSMLFYFSFFMHIEKMSIVLVVSMERRRSFAFELNAMHTAVHVRRRYNMHKILLYMQM